MIDLSKGARPGFGGKWSVCLCPAKRIYQQDSQLHFVAFWLSPEDPGALFKLPAAGKHVSPPENAFGSFQSCQNGRLGGAAVTAEVRTVKPLSLELLRAPGSLQLGEKHVSPRENAFGSLQSCQNGRLAVTAKVRSVNPLSLELPCASWGLRVAETHVSPREDVLGGFQSCQMAVWEAQPSRQRSKP